MSKPTQNKTTKIDPDSVESLKAAAHVIFPDYVTLLTIRPFQPLKDLTDILPFFDFSTEGSFVSYPKSRLIHPYKHSSFYVVSLSSQYSLN